MKNIIEFKEDFAALEFVIDFFKDNFGLTEEEATDKGTNFYFELTRGYLNIDVDHEKAGFEMMTMIAQLMAD